MPSILVEYQFRIRNAADSADELVVTSVRGGTNPYLADPPTGNGATLDPYTGKVTSGTMSVVVIDPITSGSTRLVTSILEDANFRAQLAQRRAYIEFRENAGAWQALYAGRIGGYRLVSDVKWQFDVTDWMRAEHEFSVFDMQEGETLSAYLTRWPNRGCIVGGPILGDFRGVKDLGGFQFKVMEQGSDVVGNWVRLEFVRGFHGNGIPVDTLNETLLNQINSKAQSFLVKHRFIKSETFRDEVEIPYPGFPDLAVLVDSGSGPDKSHPQLAVVPRESAAADQTYPLISVNGKRRTAGSLYLNGTLSSIGTNLGIGALTAGQILKIVVISIRVSEASPIYWTGHPVDFASALFTEAAIPKVASSLTSAKQAIGTTINLTIRLDHAWNLGQILEQAVYGPFGIGARGSDAVATGGQIELFASRKFANTLPAVTITDADVVAGETNPYDLAADAAVRRVIIEHTRILNGLNFGSTEAFAYQEVRFERTNADPNAVGTGEVAYKIPNGMIHYTDNRELDLSDWVKTTAQDILDRRGRGAQGCKTTLLRGGAGDAVKLGDEVLVDLAQLPNHNKRLVDDVAITARAMQVLSVTPTLRGKQVELEDSGPNANAIATKPTHTIAASTTNARTVALLTVTNAAALTASGLSLRVQIAITTGAAPATTDYSDALFYKSADIPTTAVGLPPITAGRTIYARARSEKVGSRPSDWSTGVGVTLTGLNAPTGLSAAAVTGDGSLMDLAWTMGASATDCLVDVYVRASGAAFSTATKRATLLAGATQFRVEGLTANTAYTFSVQHVEPGTGDVSALTETTQTTYNGARTLSAPIAAIGFSGVVPIA